MEELFPGYAWIPFVFIASIAITRYDGSNETKPINKPTLIIYA